jgi:hypothetical protein
MLLIAAACGAAADDDVESKFPALSNALPAESSPSVFNAKLGEGPDADAELHIAGSWSSTIIGSIELQKEPGGSFSTSSAQPLLFTQDPDMALSFLLYKRIFVEAKVSQDVTQAKYAAGYRGADGEFIKEVRVGNDGINFPTLPFLSFGDGSYRSFGASALVGNDTFAGKAMVRYDQASRVTKTFVGTSEVTETVITPNSFIVGKYFMTYAAPNSSVSVYVQSSSGSLSGSDGNMYRQLDPSEYAYSAVTGVISLSTAASTRVLASYPGSGAGGSTLSITISGVGACDLLYDPPSSDHSVATIDPKLQVLSRYLSTATASSGEAYVRNTASGLRDTSYQANIDDSGYIEITKAGKDAASERAAGTAEEYRQPFANSTANMAFIYTTDFAASSSTIGIAPVYSRDVVVRTFGSSSKIAIDKDFVAGSVEVTRNGVPDYAFSVDPDSGILTLASPPESSEEINISYLRESSERANGILMGALGGFWDLGSGKSAYAALGASWSMPGTSYTSGTDTSPGSITLTGGEKNTEGPFKSEADMALRYTRDDATGVYRVEGMESAGDYTTTFMQFAYTTNYTIEEVAENNLQSNFPTTVKDFHSDASTQEALEVIGDGTNPTAAICKIEDEPIYSSYKTYSFFANLPADASLTVMLDDGSTASPSASATDLSSASVGMVIPADPTRTSGWKQYLVHYGNGDSAVYRKDSEGSSERLVTGAASKAPSLQSTGSRLVIAVSGLQKGETVWIDEVCLQDSVGRGAALFQSTASYDDPNLVLGPEGAPIVRDIKATGFAQGALDSDAYVAGGGTVSGSLGFVGLGLHERTTVSDYTAHFSGGHSIELPNESFPLMLKDDFDYDPSVGAFGRGDSVVLRCGGIAALTAKQTSAWTPDASISDAGVLQQDWDNALVLGPSFLNLGLTAKNRSLPDESPTAAEKGLGYAGAWYEAFRYAMPAFESYSDLRQANANLSVKTAQGEYLSAALGETTVPGADITGTRSDNAAMKVSWPFPAIGLKLSPYYSRTWKDERYDSEDSLVDDSKAAMHDIQELPVFYRGVPFREFFASDTKSDFTDQTIYSGTGLPDAEFTPESGIQMSRESGSMPIDLVAPESLTLSYGRSLIRTDDVVTDSNVWKTSAKISAVNVFGSMGTHPIGLPFDSDEYMTTLQADLTKPKDGSASSYDVLYHNLSTFYAGQDQANRLDAETKFSVAALPSNMTWSGSLSLALSRRLEKHWLLSIYDSLVMPNQSATVAQGSDFKTEAAPEKAGSSQPSITSAYLDDLKSRTPIMRSTWTLTGGLSGARSDAEAYQPGWSFAEAYEAKLTVPERLTIKADASFTQSLDASTRICTLGFLLSLNAVVSF